MAKYRKKPVEVEAIQWDGTNANEIFDFVGDSLKVTEHGKAKTTFDLYTFEIITLEGNMLVSPYDYIIKGVQGEFYPCKPDIFEATYEVSFGEDNPLKYKAYITREETDVDYSKDTFPQVKVTFNLMPMHNDITEREVFETFLEDLTEFIKKKNTGE